MSSCSSRPCVIAAITVAALSLSAAPSSAATATTIFATGEHQIVVPAGVSSFKVTAVGGRGGAADVGANGGSGAKVDWTMPVSAGQTYYLLAGGNGEYFPGSRNLLNGTAGGGGGGGGASDIRTTPGSAGLAPDTRLLVAAGGGGGAVTHADHPGVNGGAAGQDGMNGFHGGGFTDPLGGKHGTDTAGGAAGGGAYGNPDTTPGTLALGGRSGSASDAYGPNAFFSEGGFNGGGRGGSGTFTGTGGFPGAPGAIWYTGGGGGGGGRYGGGGGDEQIESSSYSGAGGGGGSNLLPAGAVATTDTTGHPLIKLVYTDNTAPTVTMNQPPALSDSPTLTGTSGAVLGDDRPVVSVYSGPTATGAPVFVHDVNWGNDGSWSEELIDASTANGRFTAVVRQTDDAGHTVQSVPRTFVTDGVAPGISLTVLPARINALPATFSGVAGTAANDGATVTVKIDGGSEHRTLTTTRDPGTGAFQVAAPALPDGSYVVKASQNDLAGHTGQAADGFTLDTTAPVLTPVGVSVTLTTPRIVTLSGTAGTLTGDLRPVTVSIYKGNTTAGALVQTQTAQSNAATGKYSLDATPSLPDGFYTLQATQSDDVGNTGRTAPQTVTIGNPPPDTGTPPPSPPGTPPAESAPPPAGSAPPPAASAPPVASAAQFVGKPSLSPSRPTRRTRIQILFRLSAPSVVTGQLTRRARGVRSGRRCVAPPRRRVAGQRSCTRIVPVATVTVRLTKAGAGTLVLKTLAPGTYSLRLAIGGGPTVTLPIAVRR